ncbi:MAG: YolD-like family protein, partial [Clostridia bacterium]|nr:YolD-like family protein [Clostridia bacterium]
DRARQFMPFAALTGYYEVIKQREKIVEPRKELSEDEAEILSSKLNKIQKGMLVTLTYYKEECYETLTGLVSNIDSIYRTITIVKTKIAIDDIYDIEIKLDFM